MHQVELGRVVPVGGMPAQPDDHDPLGDLRRLEQRRGDIRDRADRDDIQRLLCIGQRPARSGRRQPGWARLHRSPEARPSRRETPSRPPTTQTLQHAQISS